jgi:triphosphoribosyl-dephospho-CoA synthetase
MMTIDEAEVCLKEDLFPALPEVADWMLTKSPDPQKTRRLWATAIAKLDREEVCEVIMRWLRDDADMKPPKAYERELIPQVLVSNAMFLRGKRNATVQQLQREERRRAVLERASLMNMAKSHPLWLTHWVPMMKLVKSGDLDENEAVREWKKIVEQQL